MPPRISGAADRLSAGDGLAKEHPAEDGRCDRLKEDHQRGKGCRQMAEREGEQALATGSG